MAKILPGATKLPVSIEKLMEVVCNIGRRATSRFTWRSGSGLGKGSGSTSFGCTLNICRMNSRALSNDLSLSVDLNYSKRKRDMSKVFFSGGKKI